MKHRNIVLASGAVVALGVLMFFTLLSPGILLGQPPARENVKWTIAKVEVVPPGLQTVRVMPLLSTVDVGATVQLKAIGYFEGTPILEVDLSNEMFWVSMNTAVATVTQTGLVTGIKRGQADITVGWKP